MFKQSKKMLSQLSPGDKFTMGWDCVYTLIDWHNYKIEWIGTLKPQLKYMYISETYELCGRENDVEVSLHV